MFGLEKFKDIFGSPDQGVHSYKIFGLAKIDLAASTIMAVFIADWYGVDSWIALGGVLLSGVIAHRLFGVRTAVDKVLFD